MRIIGGTHRGRRLSSAEYPGLRPTTDRIRETVFNMLESRYDLEGRRTLDLFAGTGALGLEALSRGAESCDFVELNRKTAMLTAKNIADLGFDSRARIHRIPVEAFLRRSTAAERWDLVLADPPYDDSAAAELPRLLLETGSLKDGSILVLEHSARIRTIALPPLIEVVTRTMGTTAVSILEVNHDHEANKA